MQNVVPDKSQNSSKYIKVYCACVRSILEYVCEVWHYNLPVYLSNQIEQIQKRAFRIIYPSLTYSQALLATKVPSLYDRRSTLFERLFHKMLDPDHKLNSLVPAPRINEHNLRHNRLFAVSVCRTDRYHKSFIPFVATLYDTKHS